MIDKKPRESDQLVFVANNSKITALTGWKPQVAAKQGFVRMLEWLSK
jgi:CDP-paratose 2-epimerase